MMTGLNTIEELTPSSVIAFVNAESDGAKYKWKKKI